MSEIDKDLQRRLRTFADQISPEPERSAVVVRSARKKRRLVAVSAGLALLLAISGLAGAATLLGDRGGIKPAPGPETLTETDLSSMTVDELAATLFKDDELADTVPTEAGFSLREIIRHGPERTNHDYATVGVQMDGPVDYSRVNFFVHPSERDAAEMGIRRSELLSLDWEAQRDRDEGLKPFDVSNALPGTQCGLVYGQLVSCHTVMGRVLVLTQSGDESSTAQVTDKELDAAKALIRSFGSYLERIYPPQERRFGDGNDFAGLLEDSIEAQGGAIRLQVVPESIGRGRIVEVALVNETESQIFYGHEYELERQSLRGWRHVRSPDTCVFTQELLSVAPGENARHPIGPYSDQCDVLPLRHGTYRVTKTIELESGDQLPLSVQFVVTPRPAAFLSIADAVAHLSDELEVPVALARELPDNVRLAPKNAVSITTEGGIRSGRLELRFGKNGILSFDFGRAIFDGCGGDDAEQVDINGQPGLMLAKDEYPWTQIIWPAQPGDREGTYGIYGSLPGAEMLELARSMPPLDDEAAHKTEGCL